MPRKSIVLEGDSVAQVHALLDDPSTNFSTNTLLGTKRGALGLWWTFEPLRTSPRHRLMVRQEASPPDGETSKGKNPLVTEIDVNTLKLGDMASGKGAVVLISTFVMLGLLASWLGFSFLYFVIQGVGKKGRTGHVRRKRKRQVRFAENANTHGNVHARVHKVHSNVHKQHQ